MYVVHCASHTIVWLRRDSMESKLYHIFAAIITRGAFTLDEKCWSLAQLLDSIILKKPTAQFQFKDIPDQNQQMENNKLSKKSSNCIER